ncbi:MAG: NtaA/DmoA family FMN-dependent monooxygenase [Gordonia sp. (in: high G+C Gram-positive bacteria)]
MPRPLHLVHYGNVESSPFDNGETDNSAAGQQRVLHDTVRILEDAKFDAIFFADNNSFVSEHGWPYTVPIDDEPFTIAASLGAVTSRLGLVVTTSTTFEPPITIARQTLSLDHWTAGRAGLNIVTSSSDEAAGLYGIPLPDHATRYRKADEAVAIITGLWDGFEDDAPFTERVNGVVNDVTKIHPIDYRGEFFSVNGLMGARRSPQGRPVVFQAGSSEDGSQFAARHADVVFSGHRELPDAVAYAERIRKYAAESGRSIPPLILPGLIFVLGDTHDDAEQRLRTIKRNLPLGTRLSGMRAQGLDLTAADLDAPIPDLPTSTERNKTHFAGFLAAAAELPSDATLRDLLETLSYRNIFVDYVGPPEGLVELMISWQDAGAADGFVLVAGGGMGGTFDQTKLFAERVVPLLQERGAFRTDYEGTTLREHLGLARPEHPATRPRP